MRRILFKLVLLFVFVLPGCAEPLPQSYANVDLDKVLTQLTTGERWQRHLKEDLLPFWEMDAATAGGTGDFPTYRCNDGSLFDKAAPCPELAKASSCCNCGGEGQPSCMKSCYMMEAGGSYKDKVGCIVNLNREYVRAKSRQVYAYGIAYHLTGEEKYLALAKEGVDFLRENAFDRVNGGVINFWEIDAKTGERRPAPEVFQRISQDMAYAVSGIGFYYYLTHDPEILDEVVALKEYIFSTYFDAGLDLIRWVREDWTDVNDPQSVRQKELVSQLDQVYGYMIWLTGAMPEPIQSQWKKDLAHLAEIMTTQFFSEKYGLFWGATTVTESKQLGKPHTDFGHSIKTLWLIYTIGKMTGDVGLVKFAEPRATAILERAYLPDGSWARGYKRQGDRWVVDPDKEWWALAELDQTTATLALVNPSYAQMLTTTYPYWFDHMVDKKHKGIWHMVYADGNKPDLDFPKQHSWKNAFHVFEHALVGYITSSQLHDEPVTLYYAYDRKPEAGRIHPYLYMGKVEKIEESLFEDRRFAGKKKTKVRFTDIR